MSVIGRQKVCETHLGHKGNRSHGELRLFVSLPLERFGGTRPSLAGQLVISVEIKPGVCLLFKRQGVALCSAYRVGTVHPLQTPGR